MGAIAFATAYVLASLALGWAWIAPDFRSQPRRRLGAKLVAVALVWPLILAFGVTLLLATKSKKHD
jgi:hypothetical protein